MTYILDNTYAYARHVSFLPGERDLCDLYTGHDSDA